MTGPGRSRLDWWLAGICSARALTQVVFVTYAAALPVIKTEWGLSAAASGSIPTGFHLGYAFSLVAFSVLSDRIGPKRLYLGSITGGAALSLAFALLARGYLSGLILYTLLGASLGGTYTTVLMILADQYPPHRRGLAMGSLIASTSLGHALSLVISGLALPAGGYQLSFLLTCLCPAAGAVLAWVTLIRTRDPVVRPGRQQRFSREVIKNRPAMLTIGSYTFHAWELLGMWTWTPAFLAACLGLGGLSGLKAAGTGSYISAVFYLTGLVACFSMGTLSDRLGRARVIALVSGVSAACSFAFGWTLGWPLMVVIGLGMVYAFTTIGDSPVLSAALTEVVDTPYLGAAFGLRSLLGFGAGAAAPLAFGAVLDLAGPTAGAGQAWPWGLAYGVLGLGGAGAAVTGWMYGRGSSK